MKMGFYPCPPEVSSLFARYLELDTKFPDRIRVFDPCAGEGVAIKGIADSLGVPTKQVYAVELHKGRGESIRTLMPDCNLISPASYLGSFISTHSWGLAYVNPPFDDELGGGRREEETFVRRASMQLTQGGVLLLVMPFTKLCGNSSLVSWLDQCYEDIRVFKFPVAHRKFREVALFGRRRKVDLPADAIENHGDLSKTGWRWSYDVNIDMLADVGDPWRPIVKQEGRWGRYDMVAGDPEPECYKYKIPWTHEPRAFRKITMTDEEKLEALLSSPLNDLLKSTPARRVDRPPMALAKGHVALMLASGMLDGSVGGEGVEPHVVRGTSRKQTYLADTVITENPDTGVVTQKETWSQRIEMIIRAVDGTGTIYDFTDAPPPEAPPEPEAEAKSPAHQKAEDDLTRADIARQAELAFPAPSDSPEEPAPRSWKVAVRVRGESAPSYNAVRCKTREGARLHAEDLFSRWMLMEGYEIEPSDDEPNRD